MKSGRKPFSETRDIPEPLAQGHYCREQLLCRDKVISWSHSARFQLARTLIAPFRGKRLLDYGCGDGTFLYTVRDLFPMGIGVDRAEKQLESCRARFGTNTQLTFSTAQSLAGTEHENAYSVITCMEVLEHCIDEEVERLLLTFERLLAPGGKLIISVPIESGPSLLVKELIRTFAGWRGLGNYKFKERYRATELLKMAFAGSSTIIARPRYSEEIGGTSQFFHGHKGFNWRKLRERVGRKFSVEQTLFSPCSWSLGYFSSQAWLLAGKK